MEMTRGIGEEALQKLAALREGAVKEAQEEGGYQGWKNYETWAVALWMDNEQGSYDYWRERIQELTGEEGGLGEYAENEYLEDDVKLKFALADEIKSMHEDAVEEKALDGFMADLLNGAMSEVSWDEIAGHLLESVKESGPTGMEEG